MKKLMVLCLAAVFVLTACTAPQTKTEKGAAVGTAAGAAVGAIAGQVIGKNTESTVLGTAIGAAAGAAIGAGVGRMLDKQEQAFREALAASEAEEAALRTEVVRQREDMLAIILKGDIIFAKNSAEVKKEMYPEIKRIADVMIQYPDTRITVEGHTDNSGKEDYNMNLSKQRAESVKTLLVQNGVDGSRISIMPFGETSPIASNDTPEGRQQNRRVEIKIQALGQS
jgi:outer membrane protein OmpA-like peptidoglycan-associated protein